MHLHVVLVPTLALTAGVSGQYLTTITSTTTVSIPVAPITSTSYSVFDTWFNSDGLTTLTRVYLSRITPVVILTVTSTWTTVLSQTTYSSISSTTSLTVLTTPTSTSAVTSMVTETPSTDGSTSNSSGQVPKAAIIAVSVLLSIFFLICMALFWRYRRQKRSHASAMLYVPRPSIEEDGLAAINADQGRRTISLRKRRNDDSWPSSQGKQTFSDATSWSDTYRYSNQLGIPLSSDLRSSAATEDVEKAAGSSRGFMSRELNSFRSLENGLNRRGSSARQQTSPMSYNPDHNFGIGLGLGLGLDNGMVQMRRRSSSEFYSVGEDGRLEHDTRSLRTEDTPQFQEAQRRLNNLTARRQHRLTPPPLRITKRRASAEGTGLNHQGHAPAGGIHNAQARGIEENPKEFSFNSNSNSLLEIRESAEREVDRNMTLAQLQGVPIRRIDTPSLYSRDQSQQGSVRTTMSASASGVDIRGGG